jgi:phenylacetate-coenzyme A ligase PaaK-like adenylate-forming protein
MSRLDSVYMKSPVWVQQAMVAGYGSWWYKRRFGHQFRSFVEDLRAHEQWSTEAFRAYQEIQLARLLEAASRAPYYRKILPLGIESARMSLEDLARLPLLSKEQLRTGAKQLLTRHRPRGTATFKSSGTTGTPTEIYYTREFHALEMAIVEARSLNWAGLTYRDRRVMFGARKICRYDQRDPPFWRFSPAENMAYASVYHLAPEFLPAYLRFLREFKPEIVMGYPSALYTLAHYGLNHGDLPPPARAVFTSAESLPDYMRTAIESAWQSRVFDRYGAVEGCVSASQCEHGRYHVNPEVGILEILDSSGQPAPPGLEGEIICTGLHNTLQPLIRYRIGDTARWSGEQDCPCGRQLPILEGIDGRVEDVCYTADGRRIVRFDTVFKGVVDIREAQVVQESIDSFTITVVPANGFCEDSVMQIKKNMRLHVGDVGVDLRCVATIPRTSSGKFRAVLCRLSADDKRRAMSSSFDNGRA